MGNDFLCIVLVKNYFGLKKKVYKTGTPKFVKNFKMPAKNSKKMFLLL